MAAALLACSAGVGRAVAESWTARADPAASEVRFEVGATLHTVRGTGRVLAAEIRFDPATGAAEGGVDVDVASLQSGNRARDRNLHEKVLESERFPQLAFRPQRVEGLPSPAGSSSLALIGRILIHGDERELEVPVSLKVEGARFEAVATFVIPYVAWGMNDPSKLLLRVQKQVEVTVELVGELTRSPAAVPANGERRRGEGGETFGRLRWEPDSTGGGARWDCARRSAL